MVVFMHSKQDLLLVSIQCGLHCSGGCRAARLPGQATHAARALGLWVEKYPVPAPNHQLLDWSVVLTNGRLCAIVQRDNIVVSNKHN